jgi:hypothetical protein
VFRGFRSEGAARVLVVSLWLAVEVHRGSSLTVGEPVTDPVGKDDRGVVLHQMDGAGDELEARSGDQLCQASTVFGGDPVVQFAPEDLNGNVDRRAAALDLLQ